MTRETTRMSLVRAERAELSVIDRLYPCTDRSIDSEALSRRLALEPGVRRAFLVSKELRYSDGMQLVLAVASRNGNVADLAERLAREGLLPDGVRVVAIGPHDQALESALAAVPGAVI